MKNAFSLIESWVTIIIAALLVSAASPVYSLAFNAQYKNSVQEYYIDTTNAAIIVIDMWKSHHNCNESNEGNILAKNLNVFLNEMRKKGIKIIFCIYGGHVKDTNIKINIKDMKNIRQLEHNPVPYSYIDEDRWTCKLDTDLNPAIETFDVDVFITNKLALYNYLLSENITTLFYTGQHMFQCVLWTRATSAKQMYELGFNIFIVGDMVNGGTFQPGDIDGKEMKWVQKNLFPVVKSSDLY